MNGEDFCRHIDLQYVQSVETNYSVCRTPPSQGGQIALTFVVVLLHTSRTPTRISKGFRTVALTAAGDKEIPYMLEKLKA